VSLTLIAILTAAAVLALFAAMRVIRVRSGREARPDGLAMIALVVVALLGPVVAFFMLVGSTPKTGQADAVGASFTYLLAFVLLLVVMAIVASLVGRFAPISMRPTLLLALVGKEASSLDVRVDPPITPELRQRVALVDTANQVFPRGRAFLAQTELPGFEAAWTSLDGATRELEGLITDSIAAGTGVARVATDTATDARSRLETLRRAAAVGGRAWAT
jgi:hypothetical protein